MTTSKPLTSWLHREVKRPRKQRLKAKHLDQNSVQMLGHNWMQSNNLTLRCQLVAPQWGFVPN